MKSLSIGKRNQIIAALVEGNTIPPVRIRRSGRRVFHSCEFREAETKFPCFTEARKKLRFLC